MARSLFGGITEGLKAAQENNRQKRKSTMDELIQRASLAEAGYNVQEKPGFLGFGGQTVISQQPGFQSMKELQRQELVNKLDPTYEAKRAAEKEKALIEARRESWNGGAGFGTGASKSQTAQFGGADTTSDFVMDPFGKVVKNPNKPRPMNPLQEAQLQEKKEKARLADEAEQERIRIERESSEDILDTIKTVKEGKDYFGPLGNLPSEVAPSTLKGEYGKRKNWEANVNKLLSEKVIKVMTDMKRASKTGATGFGQLSNKELDLLKEASTALKRNLKPEDAMKYLNQMERIEKKMLPNFKTEEEALASGIKGTVVIDGKLAEID